MCVFISVCVQSVVVVVVVVVFVVIVVICYFNLFSHLLTSHNNHVWILPSFARERHLHVKMAHLSLKAKAYRNID